MTRPDADGLAPFALPLRREADAVIADANGQTVLIVDPSRNLDEDAAERIADLVFARLSAAPAPEGGAVDDWRPIDSAPIGELVQVYWPCMALNDDGELTGEMLDREGHVSLSIRHSEKHGWEPDNVIEANGDWFGDDFEFGQPTHWKPRPSRPGAALAAREEAPAEAGETIEARFPELNDDLIRMASTGNTGSLIEWGRFIERLQSALRAQPPAREDAQPVAWRRALSPIDGHFTYSNVGDEGWEPLYAHPAPDALRVAVEALEKAARRFKSIRDTTDDVPHRIACSEWAEEARQALAALQAEQKGGAT